MAERPSYEAPVEQGDRRMGLVAVAVLGGIIALICIVMAFSTANTPMSNDGDRSTRSQWISEPGP